MKYIVKFETNEVIEIHYLEIKEGQFDETMLLVQKDFAARNGWYYKMDVALMREGKVFAYRKGGEIK